MKIYEENIDITEFLKKNDFKYDNNRNVYVSEEGEIFFSNQFLSSNFTRKFIFETVREYKRIKYRDKMKGMSEMM